MKKTSIYNHLIIQVTFLVTLTLFSLKPVLGFINHLADNSSDIELIEDIDEESSEKETEKETEFDEVYEFSNNDICGIESPHNEAQNDQHIHTPYFIVYSDILIPPPKS